MAFPQPVLLTLLKICRDLNIAVSIPQVVVVELEGAFQGEFLEKHTAAENRLRDLNRFTERYGIDPATQQLPSLDAALDRHRSEVSRLRREYAIELIPIPNVELETLVRQAATREAPFDSKGEGFRDALIVHSIEAVANEDGGLLTGDKDFTFEPAVSKLSAKGLTLERSIDTLVDRLQTRLTEAQRNVILRDLERAGAPLTQARSAIEQRIREYQFRPRDLFFVGSLNEVHGMTRFEFHPGFRHVRVARTTRSGLAQACVVRSNPCLPVAATARVIAAAIDKAAEDVDV